MSTSSGTRDDNFLKMTFSFWRKSNRGFTGTISYFIRTEGEVEPFVSITLQWHHNGRNGVSNHQPHHCLLNRLFRFRSKKTPKLRVTGLCAGNSPVAGELHVQMASNTENVSIWWRHHGPVIVTYYELCIVNNISCRICLMGLPLVCIHKDSKANMWLFVHHRCLWNLSL